ncbi:hypothetical protein K1719_000563 [Acacia pycnantha]|nr:hypothetical protein K1719_000563 [Acacia pycnantha]
MESKRSNQSHEEFPMNGGQGKYSYAQNSNHQRLTADVTNKIIREAILEMLDLETLLHDSSNVIHIADLGCSVGPNTFFIVQNFIDSVNLKSQSQGHGFESLEFQVFFNDHVGNDFNILFKSLPEDKQSCPIRFMEDCFQNQAFMFSTQLMLFIGSQGYLKR